MLEVDALGYETSYIYDGHNRVGLRTYPEGNGIEYEYDENHNLTKKIINPKPGSTESPITKLYTYELTFNRLSTSTNPLGHTTTIHYDSKGNLTRIEQPEVDGQIPQTVFAYNNRGQVETTTDPEAMITSYTYDPMTGDLLSTSVDQGGLNLTTQMTYDTVGNLTHNTDPRGHTTVLQYDDMRRLEQTTAPSPQNYVTKYTYEPTGNLTKVESETGDSLNPWQTTTMTYTLTGKKGAVTDPEGNITSNQYDQADRLWKVTDAESQTAEYLYDETGMLYRVIDAKGNISEEHAYTPNCLKQSLKDANDNSTLYEYDDFDRLYKTVYPDGSYEIFTYDAVGNLIAKRTRVGDTISYGYDSLNRLTSKLLLGPRITQYSYDLIGRLVDVADPNGTIHHDFDTAGRLIRVTYPDSKTVEYEYDDASNRSRLTYPDGYFVTYTYDELNRLTEVLEGETSVLAQYSYDPLSLRVTLTYGNSTSASYTYEIDDDLASINHQFSVSNVSLGYVCNNVGNRTHFTSDDDRFLFSPLAGLETDYASNNLNQYTSVSGVAFSYDGNGNLTSDGGNTYSYDAENHLIAATTPEHSAIYTYDPFGRRSAKTVDSVTTTYLHDSNQVIMEYDGSDQMLRRYVYGLGIDEPVCMTTTGAVYYYHFDGLGSVVALSDDSGNMVETYAYSPYGEVDHVSSAGNPYLYTGREYDAETRLYYYRARYYDTELGRFLQVDPIGYAVGMNLYVYVHNNPVNYIDPTGLDIYLKTGNNAKIPFTNIGNPIQDLVHQSIVVDTPYGQRALSFGMSGFGLTISSTWLGEKSLTITLLEGQIYEAGYTGGRVDDYIKTTPEQDKEFLQYLESRVGEKAGYSVGRHSCRKFSQLIFKKAKELYANGK